MVSYVYIVIGLIAICLILVWPHKIPTREECFKKHRAIWGLWYTGRDTLKEGLIQKYPDRVKKLLLLNPESTGFDKNMKETGGYDQSSKGYIIRLTKITQRYGIPVKWYDFFHPQTMTFYDPESPKNAWLLLTDAQKYTPVDSRPKHKYPRKGKNGEYEDKLASLNDIWENRSQDPNIYEGDIDNNE